MSKPKITANTTSPVRGEFVVFTVTWDKSNTVGLTATLRDGMTLQLTHALDRPQIILNEYYTILGTHRVYATARDKNGNVLNSDVINITVKP